MSSRIEDICAHKGLKMTDQRRVISRVLSESTDHPDVEEVHRRAVALDPRISIATVYRTMRLFEDAQVIERLDFGDGRARYEEKKDEHHDHLINLESGEVVEFTNDELERLKEAIARELGYRLVGHRLELYAVPLARSGEGGAD
ncbi:Fur family transcriptional regulator [Azospirillum sp. ST 5-10]|uniref:Fur family transcriptional regulator n=1 Tax=unclassified Azospirillum TaxID=2630922 RepID=UPI003F49DEFC